VWQGAVVVFSMSVTLCVPSVAVPYLFQTPVASGFGFGASILTVALALAVPAVLIMLLSATATGLMRRIGAKRTLLLGAGFGLSGLGMAVAHGSVGINLVWLAATGVMTAWAGSAAYAVGTEAVSPRQGVIVSTIYHTAGGGGAALAAAAAGYVLTVREVAVEVMTSAGPTLETFPAEEAFSWSAALVGLAALAAIVCVLTIRPERLPNPAREDW